MLAIQVNSYKWFQHLNMFPEVLQRTLGINVVREPVAI